MAHGTRWDTVFGLPAEAFVKTSGVVGPGIDGIPGGKRSLAPLTRGSRNEALFRVGLPVALRCAARKVTRPSVGLPVGESRLARVVRIVAHEYQRNSVGATERE